MSDYLLYVADEIAEETGRDPDEIAAEIMDGVHGVSEEIFRRFPPKN